MKGKFFFLKKIKIKNKNIKNIKKYLKILKMLAGHATSASNLTGHAMSALNSDRGTKVMKLKNIGVLLIKLKVQD